MQQRLIKTRLKFVGHNKDPIRVMPEHLLYLSAGETIQIRLCHLPAMIIRRTRKSYNRLERAVALFKHTGYHLIEFYGTFDAAGNHHGPGLAAYLSFPDHFRVEMLYHNGGFLTDRVFIGLHIIAQDPLRAFLIKLWIILHGLRKLIVALHRRVILQNVHNEAFFYRLLH